MPASTKVTNDQFAGVTSDLQPESTENLKAEVKLANPNPDSIEDYLDNFDDGNGVYNLPNGDVIRGKKQAKAVLKAYFETKDLKDGEVTFICIQHPSMKVFSKTSSKPVVKFVGGTFTTSDPKLIELLDNTNYVVRDV